MLLSRRYYDPTEGRFLTRDPLALDGEDNPYSYGNDDPIANVDPSGLSPFQLSLGVGAAGAVPALAVCGDMGIIFQCPDPSNWDWHDLDLGGYIDVGAGVTGGGYGFSAGPQFGGGSGSAGGIHSGITDSYTLGVFLPIGGCSCTIDEEGFTSGAGGSARIRPSLGVGSGAYLVPQRNPTLGLKGATSAVEGFLNQCYKSAADPFYSSIDKPTAPN